MTLPAGRRRQVRTRSPTVVKAAAEVGAVIVVGTPVHLLTGNTTDVSSSQSSRSHSLCSRTHQNTLGTACESSEIALGVFRVAEVVILVATRLLV